jgi:hypothetical protein
MNAQICQFAHPRGEISIDLKGPVGPIICLSRCVVRIILLHWGLHFLSKEKRFDLDQTSAGMRGARMRLGSGLTILNRPKADRQGIAFLCAGVDSLADCRLHRLLPQIVSWRCLRFNDPEITARPGLRQAQPGLPHLKDVLFLNGLLFPVIPGG